MTIGIQRDIDSDITNLSITLNRYRPDAWFSDRTAISPKDIVQYIRLALEKGWQAELAGKPFILSDGDF